VPAEVLVIDDFSRDGSLTLLRQLEAMYHEDGFRLLAFKSNAGLVDSRNQALMHARYRYITFLDADNELIPENVPYLVESLEQTKATAAYGNLLIRSPSAHHAHGVLNNESIQSKIFKGNYIDALAVLDRLQLLDAGGYEASCPAWEDYELWLHLITNGHRVVFVPVVLGYYYILPSSMSQDYEKHKALEARIKRIFDQMSVRDSTKFNSLNLKYHPAIGHL
jgi:glycosyltransferase involved in cell wall biosynthesis